MTDATAHEDLIQLIDQIEIATSQPMHAFFGSKAWTFELKHHPERFYRNENGELMWLGGKVVVIGDGKHFWSIADKIIKKENHND